MPGLGAGKWCLKEHPGVEPKKKKEQMGPPPHRVRVKYNIYIKNASHAHTKSKDTILLLLPLLWHPHPPQKKQLCVHANHQVSPATPCLPPSSWLPTLLQAQWWLSWTRSRWWSGPRGSPPWWTSWPDWAERMALRPSLPVREKLRGRITLWRNISRFEIFFRVFMDFCKLFSLFFWFSKLSLRLQCKINVFGSLQKKFL